MHQIRTGDWDLTSFKGLRGNTPVASLGQQPLDILVNAALLRGRTGDCWTNLLSQHRTRRFWQSRARTLAVWCNRSYTVMHMYMRVWTLGTPRRSVMCVRPVEDLPTFCDVVSQQQLCLRLPWSLRKVQCRGLASANVCVLASFANDGQDFKRLQSLVQSKTRLDISQPADMHSMPHVFEDSASLRNGRFWCFNPSCAWAVNARAVFIFLGRTAYGLGLSSFAFSRPNQSARASNLLRSGPENRI